MKLEVETVIEGTQQEFLGWGMGADGAAVMKAVVGSRRLTLSMTPHEAKQSGMCAIHSAFMIEMLAQQQQAGSPLVDPSGIPLGRVSP